MQRLVINEEDKNSKDDTDNDDMNIIRIIRIMKMRRKIIMIKIDDGGKDYKKGNEVNEMKTV